MYGETRERGVDIPLIYAELVEPNAGLSSIATLEAVSPALKTIPLAVARVAPTVRDERVDFSERPVHGALVEERVRLVLRELLLGDLVERHVPGSRFSQMSK